MRGRRCGGGETWVVEVVVTWVTSSSHYKISKRQGVLGEYFVTSTRPKKSDINFAARQKTDASPPCLPFSGRFFSLSPCVSLAPARR